MINRIIEFSAHNRFLVILLVAFGVAAGIWSIRNVPLDAIPDLSDTQVIVYSRWDRSPDIMEDQVTYPIVTAMLGAPRVKAVRGFSDFGYSFVYIIFDEGTDIYWARSRTLEYLRPSETAAGREHRAWPRRDRRRLGFPVRTHRHHAPALAGRAAQLAGLVPSIPAPGCGRCRRSRADRRIRAPVPGQGRPEQASGL